MLSLLQEILRVKSFIGGKGHRNRLQSGDSLAEGECPVGRIYFQTRLPCPSHFGRARFIKIPSGEASGTHQPFASLKHVRAGKKDLEALPIV